MKNLKKLAFGAAVLTGASGMGIAFAAWTADGTGSGYAQAKSAAAVTTVSATTSAQLYPGADGDLVVSVANSNDYPVTVTAINNGTGSITSGDNTCDASTGVTFTNATGLTSVVLAHSAGTPITLTGKVHMSNASVTACAGKTFTVPVSIVAASSASN